LSYLSVKDGKEFKFLKKKNNFLSFFPSLASFWSKLIIVENLEAAKQQQKKKKKGKKMERYFLWL
jgi:hypothetical protein